MIDRKEIKMLIGYYDIEELTIGDVKIIIKDDINKTQLLTLYYYLFMNADIGINFSTNKDDILSYSEYVKYRLKIGRYD